MVNIFISQPMKGKTKEEIIADRTELIGAAMMYFNGGINIIDSFVTEQPSKSLKHTSVWYLGKSLECLAKADVLVTFKNLDPVLYAGCAIEKRVAVEYGIKILEV